MANTTEDAPASATKTTSADLRDKFRSVKTQMEAEDRGERVPAKTDDEEEQLNGAEADDETTDDDAAGDTTTTEDDDESTEDDSENDDDSQNDGTQASDFKPRLSQFKADDNSKDGYLKNLEGGYLESTNEALNLKEERDIAQRQVEAIKQAAAKDPELGEKLLKYLNDANSGQPGDNGTQNFSDKATQASDNPFLVNAETEWNRKNEESVKKFVDANPEVVTDPKINSDVKRWARVFTKDTYDNEGRLLLTGEAMEMAYRHLGLGDKSKSQQNLVDGMKKNAAPTRPQAAKSKSSTKKDNKQFSDLTLNLASKMGISKERLAKGAKR